MYDVLASEWHSGKSSSGWRKKPGFCSAAEEEEEEMLGKTDDDAGDYPAAL